jgi:hypothetical protein
MTGRGEVHRLKKVLDETFERAKKAGPDPELQSDFARYLCVLVSGFIEKALVELMLEYTRQRSDPSIQRYVENRLRNVTNVNAQRLQELLGAFDSGWRSDLEKYLVDERKAALDSIINLRNTIAHGQSVGVTYIRIRGYYEHVQKVIDHIADLCVPN